MRILSLLALASFPVIAFACSSSSTGSNGSPSTSGDGGTDGTAQADGTTPTPDGASDLDTSTPPSDTGSPDTATSDAAPVCNGPTTVDYAKCIELDAGGTGNTFQDFGASPANIVMLDPDYAAGTPAAYDPPCIKIKVGQTVTWGGNFATHPLRPGACNTATGDQIPSISAGSTPVTLTMTTAGVYGFQCAVHTSAGMKGVIVAY